ncbi:MAG: Smr/MutS family protein [Candidatus Izemoplasmatales bacterium]
MHEFDIKSDLPTVEEARQRLLSILSLCRGKEKVIKIIHGYGSNGIGGAIKKAVHLMLKMQKNSRMIKAYIPGEAIVVMKGYDDTIRRFKHLIEKDADFHKGNDGITYVIL